MDAVGDVSNGNRVFVFPRRETRPHGAGNFAVQRGNCIGAARELQPEHSHAKTFVAIRMLASQRHETFPGKAEALAQRSEMLFDQIGIEAIVAGGHGSVGRENHFPRYPRHRLIEADAFFHHALPNGFQHGKSAVPFVEVKNPRGDTERFQRAQTAYTQQYFLVHTHAAIAAVQTRSHIAVFGSIAVYIGVEEKQITTADFHAPNFRIDRTMSGVDLHHDGSAIDSYGGFHGQVVDIDFEVLFALPAVAIQALTEISLAIKQAHGNQRDAQIGGALNVIAGQNSKSTGVDGKRLVDS